MTVDAAETSRPSRPSFPGGEEGTRVTPPPPLVLEPLDLTRVPDAYHPGPTTLPPGYRRAIAWFGFRSFWGHLRRFAASAIATEDVDTRDWMEPTPPSGLVGKVARTLGGTPRGATLTDCLERDVIVDFVADSGDDAVLAERVAGMIFRDYVVPDLDETGASRTLPRGDLLVHGGDVAYPVATVGEIHDRLVVPWNRALRDLGDDGRTRVLLGIPGNHDWYDGLDGFARMFRERHFAEEPEAPLEPLDAPWLGRLREYVNRFFAGETVQKQKALVLKGYKPLQRASYFILPLAPDLHLHAVDRQLRRIDYRQKRFFQQWVRDHREASRIVVLPDPVFPFGLPSKSGLQMLRALRLSPEYEPHLCLAGDIHHYRRETIGRSVHVTCGGAGAFMHPVLPKDDERAAAEVEWPSAEVCRAILRKVPGHVARGRAGLIAHAVLLALFAPPLGIGGTFLGPDGLIPGSIIAGIFTAAVMVAMGSPSRRTAVGVTALGVTSGLVLGLLPSLAVLVMERIAAWVAAPPDTVVFGLLALLVALLAGGYVFGAYLAALTHFGLESTQAFTALAHGSHRHFVRMRVHQDGRAVDVYVIGLEDPHDPACQPGLVDAFRFTPTPPGTPSRRSALECEPGGLRPSIERRRTSLAPERPSGRPS